jgi:hypothetical protein
VHRCFAPRIHQNALRDPPIPLDAKPQVRRNISRCAFLSCPRCTGRHYLTRISKQFKNTSSANVSWCAFYRNRTGPHPSIKESASTFRTPDAPECTITHKSERKQKHKFGVRCPSALFMETAQGPPEHKNGCVDVSCPRNTKMNYVTL